MVVKQHECNEEINDHLDALQEDEKAKEYDMLT